MKFLSLLSLSIVLAHPWGFGDLKAISERIWPPQNNNWHPAAKKPETPKQEPPKQEPPKQEKPKDNPVINLSGEGPAIPATPPKNPVIDLSGESLPKTPVAPTAPPSIDLTNGFKEGDAKKSVPVINLAG